MHGVSEMQKDMTIFRLNYTFECVRSSLYTLYIIPVDVYYPFGGVKSTRTF